MLARQDTISAGCDAMLPRIELLRGPDRFRRSQPGEHGGGARSLRSQRGKGRGFPKSGKALRFARGSPLKRGPLGRGGTPPRQKREAACPHLQGWVGYPPFPEV